MNITLARVLVVDDEEVMRTFVVNALRRLGIQAVETCNDGAQALKTAAQFKPDLILTDIHMKPMDGLEFVRVLRRHPDAGLRQSKVIFMSADATRGTLEEALPLGTYGYIVKPPHIDTLRTKLEQALK